jgi:hypothetical protein
MDLERIREGLMEYHQQVKIRSADLNKIENGRMTGHWYLFDQLDLLKQTGAIISSNEVVKDE